ncbi:MAG: hypothetical protein JWO87_244 [Phycisphaerales bacterium]|nr:hypothetical protein [Phycisphaerales bacterium]
MKIEDIQVNAKALVLATPADVDGLAARMWITFPAGYREYVTRLGEGVLGGCFVRIYPPWRIEKELIEWRRRINKYWLWDDDRELLPKERALECVIIGDTVNGDELVFHPGRPDRLFILPRDSERVFEAGTDLLAAIDWMCSSGELVEALEEREFEPFDSRAQSAEEGERTGPIDPAGEALDDIVELGKAWARRHGTRNQARNELKTHTGKGKGTQLLYESFIVEGQFPHAPGYAIAWRIIDSASGLEVGVFRWHKSDESHGSSFEPNQINVAKLRDSSSK